MKRIMIPIIGFIAAATFSCTSHREPDTENTSGGTDVLPAVLTANHTDYIEKELRLEAALKFKEHQLQDKLTDWGSYRTKLKNDIIQKTGTVVDHELPINIRETLTMQMSGYKIKNISFQTRPGIYATANLYIPDGQGPFPGVIVMCGHSSNGRIYPNYQSVGHTLALNGYVALAIDPWGAGERTTTYGIFEYHGSNLGASLMNVGESLMGMQITDNIRGIDLLSSLPYVDPEKIGATGASGGGNQTMWLAAIDERVKASVPVVSVGTFESYVMRDNCICEVLIDGLTLTEESGVLALVAPRAIKMCNHNKDASPTFTPSEMLRSYNEARLVFIMLGVENKIAYQLFDLVHGYMPEDREAMLGWFDFHLKGIGTGEPKKEMPFGQVSEEKLLTFSGKSRDAEVISTDSYCKRRGNELRTVFLNTASFDLNIKKVELQNVLRINEKSDLKVVHQYPVIDGWNRFTLETSDNKVIPLLLRFPSGNTGEYVIIINPDGKSSIMPDLIEGYAKSGMGIAIADLSGTGEIYSSSSANYDKRAALHTMSRAELWLGKTVIGEWVKELSMINQFLHSSYNAQKVSFDGSKEAGLAGLFMNALEGNTENVILRNAPPSYLFDNRQSVDYFSMGIHLPGFLKWGDVSLAAAMSGKNITFINPVTMSGQKLNESMLNEYQTEFDNIRIVCKQPGKTTFK